MDLQVKNLSKKFKSITAVDDMSFQLGSGRCIALLGANGAGKTTTLRMLAGLLSPTSGQIQFKGYQNGHDIRHHIGYLPQYPVFHGWMTGKEFLVYVGQLANLSKTEATERAGVLLDKVGIKDSGHLRISRYSGGMRQRLGIAQALIHKPALLLLDEPVSSLDPIGRREVLTLLQELKDETTILFSTHILNDAEEISDGLLLMHEGRLVEHGDLAELRVKYQSQKIELNFNNFEQEHLDQLAALPGIAEVTANQHGIVCLVDDVEKARQSLLTKTVEQGWGLTNFNVARTTLEDMFMEVVNK